MFAAWELHCRAVRDAGHAGLRMALKDRWRESIARLLHRAIHQGCGFVIRVSRLKRKVVNDDGRTLPLVDGLPEWSTVEVPRQIQVPATTKSPARVAKVVLRYGTVLLPVGQLIPG